MLPGGSGSTVAVSVKHSIRVTLARKEGASVSMENCANISDSLPNLDSPLQHCGVLSRLLGDSTQLTLTRTLIIFWQFKLVFACNG